MTMTLRRSPLRGFRVTATMLLSAALLLTPAAAQAGPKKAPSANKKPVALHEAHGKKPAAGKVRAVGRRRSATAGATAPQAAGGLGSRVGLSTTLQLAAMTTAIDVSPGYWTGLLNGCNVITPLLASQPGQIMAGNFRDAGGNCYVWLNLQHSTLLSGSEICKVTLHELGHLNGLQHSTNPLDVMFSPFVSDPIPGVCQPAAG